MSVRTFIVDDDLSYSKMLKHSLEQKGMKNIATYESGEDCLNNLNKNPGLILLDFRLDGLNGLDTLQAIKKKNSKPEVIVITGLDSPDLADKCIEAGALDFIAKNPGAADRIISIAQKLGKKKTSRNLVFLTGLIIVAIAAYYLLS